MHKNKFKMEPISCSFEFTKISRLENELLQATSSILDKIHFNLDEDGINTQDSRIPV